MGGLICHDPAWLFVLCKPRRGIDSPGVQRGPNTFSGADHTSCPPPCQEHLMGGKASSGGVCKGGQVMGPNVVTSLPGCCAELWLLPSFWGEAALPWRRQCLHCQGCNAGAGGGRMGRGSCCVGEIQLFTGSLLVSLPKCYVPPRRVCLNQWVILRNQS